MQFYPYASPVILNDSAFADYGGQVGTFTIAQRQNSYLVAEMQVSKYIGSLLLPTNLTGTYPYTGIKRIITDYGYVNSIIDVSIISIDSLSSECHLNTNSGCAFIYEDTFGYVDVRQVLSANQAGIGAWYPVAFPAFPTFYYPLQSFMTPYQFKLTYNAGLPSGISISPTILEALTIMAQINLNERNPGDAGMNEGAGDISILKFSDLGYRGYSEERKPSDLRRTILGSSPRANYAARLIDATVKKARPLLRM